MPRGAATASGGCNFVPASRRHESQFAGATVLGWLAVRVARANWRPCSTSCVCLPPRLDLHAMQSPELAGHYCPPQLVLSLSLLVSCGLRGKGRAAFIVTRVANWLACLVSATAQGGGTSACVAFTRSARAVS